MATSKSKPKRKTTAKKTTKSQTFKKPSFSRPKLIAFSVIFALVGGFGIYQALAATTCLVSNRTAWSDGVNDCVAGSTITLTNAAFACNQALSSYGTLPLKVVVASTGAWDAAGAVTLDNGCSGDNNPDTIDLIVDIQGNGPKSSTGSGHDSFKTRQSPGPRDIQVTGRMECGRQAPGAHQDMMQFQGGSNITIVNATSGNYANGTSTCQGAGGVIFSSAVTNLDILGGSFLGCNHGVLGGSPSSNPGGEIRDTKFRSGRVDGSDPNCVGFSGTAPCQTDLPLHNVTCSSWNRTTSRWVDEIVNPSSSTPPPTAPAINLSATPAAITSGGSSTLTWTSTNATGCTASGAWTGTRAVSGSQAVSPTATSTYTLACTGAGGTSNNSVTVSVSSTPIPPPPPTVPTVRLTANPTTIASGASSTLSWSSTNATTCTASGAWSGSRAVSGSQAVTPTTTSTYTLACTGAGGTASSSVPITVLPPNDPPPPPPPSGGDNGDGLSAAYYDNRFFQPQVLKISRVDKTVDFDWGRYLGCSPGTGVGCDTFSARWTGRLKAKTTETYTITTQSDDAIRLWINDRLVIDNWTYHPATYNSATIALRAGEFYRIKIEFIESTGGAVAKLFWSSPSMSRQIIPQSQLYSK